MIVSQISVVSFNSYQSPLKKLFKEGKMPSVKYGIYGNPISPDNVSLEHIKPRSKGGLSALKNYALADRKTNADRGSEPFKNVCDWEMVNKYLSQFNFKIKGFDGFAYQDMIRKTCEKLKLHEILPWKRFLFRYE